MTRHEAMDLPLTSGEDQAAAGLATAPTRRSASSR